MKLHLPLSLRRCLIAAFALAAPFTCVDVAEAAYLHQDVSIKTYTDFAQNKGRYAVGKTNALLQHLNKDGVSITYTGGQAPYTLEHGMIDFDSQVSSGEAAAIGYNFLATVAHVSVVDEHYNKGVMDFTRNAIGRENSVLYMGIEYAGSSFLLKPSQDYKITRLNKLVTDVTGSAVYGSVDGDYSGITERGLAGELLYRSGSGHMYTTSEDGSRNWCANPYTYITGGIDTISSINVNSADGCFSTVTYFTYTGEEVGVSEPLPYKADQGDSGSPSWVWNDNTQQYEYLAALQSGNANNMSQFRGQCEWTNDTMAQFDVSVAVSGDNALYLHAVDGVGETIADEANDLSTTLHYGLVTDASGRELARYNGVEAGTHTWKELNNLKDTANWYHYGEDYFNASATASSSPLTYADLFYNSNLVIAAASGEATQYVHLMDTVDLGIGYVQFSLGEGMEHASFVVDADGGAGFLLNTAGYVVDKGVSVHLQLTNPADYMREWRKVGEGDLYIEGQGNNDALLNLGGSGATYLQREGGYAAYNVLANNGATVVIDSIDQIARDFTFGNRGGVLDMNGIEAMEWNNGNEASAAGFTIHALDEGAMVVNRAAGTHTRLTWTQGGAQTWIGSFADTEASALSFIYNGGAGAHLTMHSILTNLQHADSGMEVASGTVTLVGTDTVHALGSQGAWNSSARYSSTEDWHYADARMNVSVAAGATFELGSHARLMGDVSVASGGTYIMREGVKHRMEYIEGGYEKEDTDAIRAFFGHKGNTELASGATMQVAFSEGTDSTLVYAGNISGEGNVSVAAQGGILRLEGTQSTFSGTKELTSGGLWAASNGALGDTATNKWVVGERAWLASDGFTDASTILNHIDGSSTGVLALSRDVAGQLDLSGHGGLIIGAAAGCDVRYGTEAESLASVNGRWVLGGGGGNLDVAFRLTGENDLVLGNAHGTGNVHLSNGSNDFTGDVLFVGGVTLSYDEGALGNAMIDLSYGNRALLVAEDIGKVKAGSQGVVLLDRMPETSVDLSSHTSLALGASADALYSGSIAVAEGAAYRFGGSTGQLTVATQLESGHSVVIDGQGYSGGRVVLTGAQAVDGHVAVMGYDPAYTTARTGDITLSFAADNALAKATGFAVRNGGVIDLAGTNQSLAGMELASGGTICDSSEGRTSTLTLTGNGSIASGSVLDVAHVVKVGTGTLTLSNTSTFSDFAVTGGTLRLSVDGKNSANGSFRVEGSGVFDLNSANVTGSITLAQGGTLSNVAGLSAALHVLGDSTLQTVASGGAELSGAISVAEGAALSLQAGTGTLWVRQALSGAGEVNLSARGAACIEGNNSAYTGTLAVSGTGSSNVVSFKTATAFGAGVVRLDNISFAMDTSNAAGSAVASCLDIGANGATFNGAAGQTYHFSGLSGSGTLRSAQTGGGAMRFGGDVSAFSGTLDSSAASGELTIGFGGSGANYHSLANKTSADAARLFAEGGARLKSTGATVTYEFAYADKVELNATVEDKANVTQAGAGTLVLSQANSSSGTLTINAGATVELVDGGTWAGSLAGSGTLDNRSTQAVTIASASGFSGNLGLMQGSTLALGAGGSDVFSLGVGQQLAVLAPASGVADSAILNVSALELNGGSLAFSGEALKDGGGALLSLYDGKSYRTVRNGTGSGGQTTIAFFDTSGMAVSTEADGYALLQGNLSGIASNSFTATGLDECFTASFSVGANNTILFMTLSAKEGHGVWAGTASQSGWEGGFGSSSPAVDATAWFNDTAEEKTVTISGEQKVANLIFNATEDYTLATAEGNTLAASGTLELRNSGKVTLGNGVSVAGAVSLADGSELEVQSFASLSGKIDGQGATLTINAEGEQGNLQLERLGMLQLKGGSYELEGTVAVDTIKADGGQLYISQYGTYGNKLVLGDNGSEAALRLAGNASQRTHINGAVSLVADSAVEVEQGLGLFNSSLSGNQHTLTKKGAGTLWLATSQSGGFSAEDVSFVVESGNLRIGGTSKAGIPTGIDSVELKKGATLSFCAASSTMDTALTLEGGSAVDLVSTNGGAASYTFDGAVALTGSGYATLSSTSASEGISAARTLTFNGEVSGQAGLALSGSGAIVLNLENEGNSFAGGISVSKDTAAATINLASAGAAGSGAIDLGSGSSSLLQVKGNADSYGTLYNAISGAGAVVVQEGMLEMAGNTSYTGSTTVKSGAVLKLSAASSGSSRYVVENGASLVLAGDASVSVNKAVTLRANSAASPRLARAAAVEGMLENVTVTDESLSCTEDGLIGRVSAASVRVESLQYTLANLELASSQVQVAATGAKLVLDNIVLDAATTITGAADYVEVAMQNVTHAVGMTSHVLARGNEFDLAASDTVAVYSLSQYAAVALTGNLQLSLEGVLPQEADYVALVFGDDVDVSALRVSMSFAGGDTLVSSSTTAGDNTLLFSLSPSSPGAVPEPASGMLALLGLAGLALRRRRK